jgi:hypothetical protein
MGARFGSECFSDVGAAASAACATAQGVASAGSLHCYSSGLGSEGTGVLYMRLTAPGGQVTQYTETRSFQSCDPFEEYQDLLTLYGAALAALVGVWLVKQFVLKLVLPQ